MAKKDESLKDESLLEAMLAKRNFKDEVEFDRFALDVVSEKHSGIYLYWAQALAEAKAYRDAVKDQYDLIVAERELYIREHAETIFKKIDGKVTEAVIKAGIQCDAEVQAALQKTRDAAKIVYTLEAAVKAMEHRKDSINNAIQLWIKGYYSKPDGGKAVARADNNSTDAIANDVRKNLSQKKRSED